MIVLYSEKPPQDQPLFDATAEVWPVHCWVASLLSMDSMTLAMSFMTFPLPAGRCALFVDVGLLKMWASKTCVGFPKHSQTWGLADGRALLGEAAPGPAAVRRDCGSLAGPLLGGVFAEHGLDDLGDELHDASLTCGVLRAVCRCGLLKMWASKTCIGFPKHSQTRGLADDRALLGETAPGQ